MASIEKRGNAYRIVVSLGVDIFGKKITEKITFKPDPGLTPAREKKAVETFARDFEQKVLNGLVLDGRKVTLQQFTERWLHEYAEQNLQPGTIQKYQEELMDKILPALGHLKLNDLKPHVVNSFFVSLTKDGARKDGKPGGYSRGSIAKTRNVLSSVLRVAVEWEVIDRNPCDKTKVKGEDTADHLKFWTPEQTGLFLDYIEMPYTVRIPGHDRIDDTGMKYSVGDYTTTKNVPEQLVVLFNLAVFTGMRKGEIVALQWSDIDFESDRIKVQRAVTVVQGKQVIKPPKTKTSHRTISIPHSLTVKLRHWQKEQIAYRLSVGDFWQGDNWVFTQANGKMMSYSTPYESMQDILRRYNENVPEEQKLPVIPFHGLRHTSATLLIASNQDVRSVSARLGHAQTSTTMNIYAHALEESDRKAADALENMLVKQA